MPELARTIAAVSEAAEDLEKVTEERAEAMKRFREALREAHDAGASYGLLGRLVGLSRQRVAKLVERE